jgi:hypothetical protein
MHVCTRTHKPFNVLLKICYSQNINIVVWKVCLMQFLERAFLWYITHMPELFS